MNAHKLKELYGKWLMILAPLYIVSPLTLVAIPQIRQLSPTLQRVLLIFAVSQLLPAAFTPEPLSAFLYSLLRVALIIGAIGVGLVLKDSRALIQFSYGIMIVCITSLIYSAWGNIDMRLVRLSHPYMTSITVGMGAALGICIAIFSDAKLKWKALLITVSLPVLLLSGSRTGIVALFFGVIIGSLLDERKFVRTLGVIVMIFVTLGIGIGKTSDLMAIERLSNQGFTGRDILWEDVTSIIQTYPLTGVGSYRVGEALSPQDDSCFVFEQPDGLTPSCPTWATRLGNPWRIAHNYTLQKLAEAGPVGLFGELLLMTCIVVSAFVGRDALVLSSMVIILAANITDNTLIPPSPFFAEVFWILGGIVLANAKSLPHWSGILGIILALILSSPVLAKFTFRHENKPAALTYFFAEQKIINRANYAVYVQPVLAPGEYRLVLKSCPTSCITLDVKNIVVVTDTPPIIKLSGKLFDRTTQKVTLQIWSGQSNLLSKPMAEKAWIVKCEKLNSKGSLE